MATKNMLCHWGSAGLSGWLWHQRLAQWSTTGLSSIAGGLESGTATLGNCLVVPHKTKCTLSTHSSNYRAHPKATKACSHRNLHVAVTAAVGVTAASFMTASTWEPQDVFQCGSAQVTRGTCKHWDVTQH